MLTRVCAAIGSLVVAIVGFAPSVAADPKGEIIPITCGGQEVLVAVGGNGPFSLGHFVGGTAVYVVQSIDATFTFTPTEGEPEVETIDRSTANIHGDTVTCTFNIEETVPEGTFTGSGTVVVFITPSR